MCTFNTDTIYLTWRKGAGFLRHIIGVLHKDENNTFSFKYSDKETLDKAKKDGFLSYPGFQNYDDIYKDVLEHFTRRLPNSSRRDYDDFLDYWCAKGFKNNNFALLGLTGAKLHTDNFEFIAPHPEVPAAFYTDIAGLHHLGEDALNALRETESIDSNLISLKAEPENQFDKNAVKVFYRNFPIGYIKIIHSKSVSEALKKNLNISTTVKNIIKNGFIKEILLEVQIN